MKKHERFPLRLKLLPGLRWRGELTVVQRTAQAEFADIRYVVAFNAERTKAEPRERWVYDRAVLTANQLKDWTGWSE